MEKIHASLCCRRLVLFFALLIPLLRMKVKGFDFYPFTIFFFVLLYRSSKYRLCFWCKQKLAVVVLQFFFVLATVFFSICFSLQINSYFILNELGFCFNLFCNCYCIFCLYLSHNSDYVCMYICIKCGSSYTKYLNY